MVAGQVGVNLRPVNLFRAKIADSDG